MTFGDLAMTQEDFSDFYNWKGLEFPVTVSQIDKFEKNNKDIAVNVLYLHQKEEGKSKVKIRNPQEIGWQYNLQQGGESTPDNRW